MSREELRKELKKQYWIAGKKSVDWGKNLQKRYNAQQMQCVEEILTHMRNEFNGFYIHNDNIEKMDEQLHHEA